MTRQNSWSLFSSQIQVDIMSLKLNYYSFCEGRVTTEKRPCWVQDFLTIHNCRLACFAYIVVGFTATSPALKTFLS